MFMREEETKLCTVCLTSKPLSEFHLWSKSSDGHNPQCKSCRSLHGKKWYAENTQVQNNRVNASRDKQRRNNAVLGLPHQCNKCGRKEPEVSFAVKRVDGKIYKRFACYECMRLYKKQYLAKSSLESQVKSRAKKAEVESFKRGLKEYTAIYVFKSSRSTDKRFKRDNDLTLSFVKKMLEPHECMYCGETEIKMTLDRIDNSVGHLQDNVNPACIRCNGIRSNMPYEAWIELAPRIREIREKGMLDGWIGRSFAKKLTSDPRTDGFTPAP